MGVNRSAAEAEQDAVRAMGDRLGRIYHALWQEIARLHLQWCEYVELFGTNTSRVELMNRAAPRCFANFQQALLEGIILHVTRLTDRHDTHQRDSSRSRNKRNLSFMALAEALTAPDVKQRVTELIKLAEEASEFCRDWRNRRIAHADFDLSLDPAARPLEPVIRQKLKAALDALGPILNALSEHYQDSTSEFSFPSQVGGALDLLWVLRDGVDARDRRDADSNAGNRGQRTCGPTIHNTASTCWAPLRRVGLVSATEVHNLPP